MWPMFLGLTLWASAAALPTLNRATGGPTLSELQQTLLQSQNRNRVLLEILKVRAPGAALRPYRQHLVQAGHLDGLGRPALKALLLQARQDRRRLELLKSGAGQLPGSGQLLGRRAADMTVTSNGALVTDWNVVVPNTDPTDPTDPADPSEGGGGEGPSRGDEDGEEEGQEEGGPGVDEGEGHIIVPQLVGGEEGDSEEDSGQDSQESSEEGGDGSDEQPEDNDADNSANPEDKNGGKPNRGKNSGVSVKLPEKVLAGKEKGLGKKLMLLLRVQVPMEIDGIDADKDLQNLHVVGSPKITNVKEELEEPSEGLDGDFYDEDFGYDFAGAAGSNSGFGQDQGYYKGDFDDLDNDFAEGARSNNGFGQDQGYYEGDFGDLDNDFASGGFGQGTNYYDRDFAPTAVLVDTSDYQGPPADMDEMDMDEFDGSQVESPTTEDLDDDFEYNRK